MGECTNRALAGDMETLHTRRSVETIAEALSGVVAQRILDRTRGGRIGYDAYHPSYITSDREI